MANYNVVSFAKLVEAFQQLPSIGNKTAQRIAFKILNMSNEQVQKFTETILEAHSKIKRCEICQNLTEEELCSICQNQNRDKSVICVVEDPRDVMAIERTHDYNGTYHVLHGAISPMDNIGADQIAIKELIARLGDDTVEEVIMATNPTPEGEVTAMYISRLLKPMGIAVSRLAYGVPVGADLEYADEVTLSRAIEGRSKI